MANRNNPDSEQDEQERLEQERRERERAAALRGQLRQSPDNGGDAPAQDSSKNPVIINK
jgi:hypothetical protein